MNILIVDDLPQNLRLLRVILEAEDHSVMEAADGTEALAILAHEKMDVIISDILMPRMDGYRFCYEVRASAQLRHLPFIFYTSTHTSASDEKLALEMGADKFLTKPAPAAEIIQALQEVTAGQRNPITPTEPSRELNLMKEYNQQLVAKLEEKNSELIARNQELLLSEQKLLLQSTALETAANAVVITDTRGIILWVNPAFSALTGYAGEEVLGKTPRLLKSGRHDREFYHNLWTTVLSGQTWRGNFTNRRKDGSLYHDEHTITPVRSKEGVITHFIAIMNDVTKRKQAEQQLTLLNTCVANLNDIVLITEADPIDEPGPKIVFVNEAFERITGYTSAETLGRSPRFLQGEKTDRRVLDEIRAALAQHQPIRRQIINYGKDGSEYWLDIDIVPIFDAASQCTHFVAIERDVTEEKKTQESLKLFRTLIDRSNDAIEVVDAQTGRFLDVNETACQRLGYRREEILALRVPDIVDTGSPLSMQAEVEEIRKAGSKIIEGWHRRKDGSTFPIEVNVQYIDLNQGYLISVVRDITERKRAEEQIAEQATFLDKARDAIIARDLEGKILFWNEGAERMYGWPREEAVGRNIAVLVYPNPLQFEEVNNLTISQGEWHGELQHVTRDGRELTVEARWTLIRDDAGRPKSVLAIDTDITEKKKIEAQFMRAQRMESIGTLAGGIAHDLNNILAPIMMSIDILKSTSTHPQAQRILETIEVSAQRGADIVRQVLSFARGLESQRIEIQPKHLLKDLEHIIKDTFPKDIRLHFSIPNDTWTILGDPTQIHQILLNLSVNARDAMPHGGTLSVSVENSVLDEQYAAMNLQAKAGRYVKIIVTDSGTGIPPALLEKIFEPFFTTKNLNKGTGLGLSTVMAIVKSHEGIINVYSEPGKGTTFNVYLPAMEASMESRAGQSEEATLPRGKGETVLVVDDEASILTITGQTLQAFGYKVLTATDGAAAVAVYAQHRDNIDVVLTDMMMPVMDGPATIHALMRINPGVKVIAASGLTANGSVVRMSGDGVKHFLTKPYTAGTLLKTIRTILDEP
jgi:PAS domain S-box-containing protein